MHKPTVGAAVISSALIASLALGSGATATATSTATPIGETSTAGAQGLAQTNLPVFIDPDADLTANPDRLNESWYVTGHVTAGGHRYGFLVHYLSTGNATQQGPAGAAVSITDEATGWYTKSEILLPSRKGLSDKPGMDIHTDNITWTGTAAKMEVRAKVPAGEINFTLRPEGNVLYNMGTGYFPMFGDTKYPNYEYALPSMDTSGTLTLNGRTNNVSGEAWLDRQWGPLPDLATGRGHWTWMNLNLSNGDKISLWKTRYDKENTWATILKPDGTHTVTEATLTPDASSIWTSPVTGRSYSTRWKVTIASQRATLGVTAYAKDQELATTGPRYEGSARVTGTYGGGLVSGVTYVENFPEQ